MHAKICGIKNTKTLKYLINHKYPPKFVGFICNYPKSHRNLNFKKLKELIDIKKNAKINYVAVLVNPKQKILKKIMQLNFDYLQLYNVSPEKTKNIKKQLKIKIITALTIDKIKDVKKYKDYKNISEIILFDSKGYEKSLSFNHKLLKIVPKKIKKMIAGNIQYNDKLDKYSKMSDIIDISGSLETKGEKDFSKIDIFLKEMNKI
tara:strand:- start:159 stop:773 length:615 start_codon:yes stop_codon:yes gene_type:complete